MKKWIGFLALITLCGGLFAQEKSNALQFVIEPGPHWIGEGKVALVVPIEVEPSFALWVEDSDGNYLETIYVTGKVANGTWNATSGRPEALPVWGHARGQVNEKGEYLPSEEQPVTDAQSSATPMGIFNCSWDGLKELPSGNYRVMLEVNISFDYNETWKKRVSRANRMYENGVNGQPSLVYQAEVLLADDTVIQDFQLIGCGSPLGEDGNIYPLDGIDTAKEIIKEIRIETAAP